MGNGKSEIRAVAETDTELILIPLEYMDKWMAAYPGWRRFIIDSYHARMMELMETVDTLAFIRETRMSKTVGALICDGQMNPAFSAGFQVQYFRACLGL